MINKNKYYENNYTFLSELLLNEIKEIDKNLERLKELDSQENIDENLHKKYRYLSIINKDAKIEITDFLSYSLKNYAWNNKEFDFKEKNYFFSTNLKQYDLDTYFSFWKPRKQINYKNYDVYSFIPNKLLMWNSIIEYPESFWYVANKAVKARRKKVYFTKCSNRTLTMSGWAFVTPFSSNTNLLVLVVKI